MVDARFRHSAVDTHVHLNFDSFDTDREDVLSRAHDAEIAALINVAIDVSTSAASIALAERYPEVWATVGVHPHDAESLSDKGLRTLAELAGHAKVVAVGEVGLDLYRNLSPPETQEAVFRQMSALAREVDLPLIIHTREAGSKILEVLREELRAGPLHGVFHCFSGDETMLQEVLDLGFHVSFCGNLTFKNSRAPETLRRAPLERLLLETDSPFLAPVPYRGKRNEPAYVRITARKIAEIKHVPIEEILNRTTANAVHLFGLRLPAEGRDAS